MIDIFTADPRLFYVLVGFFALIVWSNRDVRRNFFSISADIVGVVTIAFALLFAKEIFSVFTNSDAKSIAKTHMIFIVFSAYIFPAIGILASCFFGRIIGRILRRLTRPFRGERPKAT